MMNDEIIALQARISEVTEDCQRFCYLSRAKELQLEASKSLESLKVEACTLKERMISNEDEDSANAALTLEEAISALASELRMWIALKDDKPSIAWNYLVDAQNSIRVAVRAHCSSSTFDIYVGHLHALERILFPPQLFFSVGFVVVRAECSICEEEYDECDHIKGKAYMGRICSRRIKEAQLQEVSIVDEPANKLCRILSFTDEGVTRDFLTWREIFDASTRTSDG